ncbi:MAG: FAD-binding protein [Deltaproteobacteria bacterium]|nr:FAD-binding protein [Deltaproteobacteria bacterium]
MQIAIIGSGMAGLVAGYLCRQAGHDVTVFESAASRGMDAHTLEIAREVSNGAGSGWVDVPLRIMSSEAWRTVLTLCRQLKVPTFDIDVDLSFSSLAGATWLSTGRFMRGDRVVPLVGSWRYFNLDALTVFRSMLRLRRDIKDSNLLASIGDMSINEFFTSRRYPPRFWKGCLLPVLGTITTCSREHLGSYPARDLLASVWQMMYGDKLRRLSAGTRDLAQKLTPGLRFISGAKVVSVEAAGQGLRIRNAAGAELLADHVVVATQANQIDFLRGEVADLEHNVLQDLTFDEGELLVHTDERSMPRRRSDWKALNFLMDDALDHDMFTVWVNQVEPSIKHEPPIFQTWNPIVPIDPIKILSRVTMQRSVVTPKSRHAWQALADLSKKPGRRVHYCGSWSFPGVPLLESAARSAIRAAGEIGVQWQT